jgi:hypothetical protein
MSGSDRQPSANFFAQDPAANKPDPNNRTLPTCMFVRHAVHSWT